MRSYRVYSIGPACYVELLEVPFWARLVSWAAEELDARLGHALCGEGLPDWVWLIPVGWPRRDAEGVLENSLGSRIHTAFTWLLFLDVDHSEVRAVVPALRSRVARFLPAEDLES